MVTEFEFLIFVLGLAGLIFLFERPLWEWSENRRYRREKEKFRKEVEAGKFPSKCPMRVTYNGAFRLDTADLIHTKQFRKLIGNSEKK